MCSQSALPNNGDFVLRNSVYAGDGCNGDFAVRHATLSRLQTLRCCPLPLQMRSFAGPSSGRGEHPYGATSHLFSLVTPRKTDLGRRDWRPFLFIFVELGVPRAARVLARGTRRPAHRTPRTGRGTAGLIAASDRHIGALTAVASLNSSWGTLYRAEHGPF